MSRAVRHLNGFMADTGATWITGVNPRYSNFKGVGHGVQWNAASTQDLTAWAYSKINDGNIYPVVFFVDPPYGKYVEANKMVTLEIRAHDQDGQIAKVDIFMNNKFIRSLTQSTLSDYRYNRCPEIILLKRRHLTTRGNIQQQKLSSLYFKKRNWLCLNFHRRMPGLIMK